MITITARTFWNAENSLTKRNSRRKTRLIRKEVESQLRKQLAKVKTGSLYRNKVCAPVTIEGQFFPGCYEKELNKRGFLVLPDGEYNPDSDTQRFHIVIKGCEQSYCQFDFNSEK